MNKRALFLTTLVIITHMLTHTGSKDVQTLRETAIARAIQGLLNDEFTLDQINPNSRVPGTKLPSDLYKEVENVIQQQYKAIEQTIARYPSMAFVPEEWSSRPFLRKAIHELQTNVSLKNFAMKHVLSNPQAFATAVQGLSRNKDSFYSLLAQLFKLGFDVNQPINNESLLSLALGKNFEVLASIITHKLQYIRNPNEIVLSPEQTRLLKQLIQQTATVQNDISVSPIVLSEQFPELLAALIAKGLRVNSTQFLYQILVLLRYDKFSQELLVRNLQALLDQGALPFSSIEFSESDGNIVTLPAQEYVTQFIHGAVLKKSVLEMLERARLKLLRK